MRRIELAALRREQETIARRVRLVEGIRFEGIRIVAGADLTFLNPWKTPTVGIASFVVLSFPSLDVIEQVVVEGRVTFPYIATYLAYRELPLLLKAFGKLKQRVDVVMIDGQGIAHPRRCGIGSHFGVETGVMTIGCAKSWLYGDYHEPSRIGQAAALMSLSGERIGSVLRSSRSKHPLFVSPGHRITVDTALKLTRACLSGHRIPEPTRLAHDVLRERRRALLESGPEFTTGVRRVKREGHSREGGKPGGILDSASRAE